MIALIKSLLMTSIFLSSVLANASYHYQNQSLYHPIIVEPDNKLKIGNLYYKRNLHGFRSLIDENLREKSPEIYGKINQQLSQLEAENRKAQGVLVGSIALGAAYALSAPVNHSCELSFTSYSGTTECLHTRESESRLENLYAGLTIMLVGGLIAAAIEPNNNDINRLVNYHNRMNPENPIDFGFNIQNEGMGTSVSFRF